MYINVNIYFLIYQKPLFLQHPPYPILSRQCLISYPLFLISDIIDHRVSSSIINHTQLWSYSHISISMSPRLHVTYQNKKKTKRKKENKIDTNACLAAPTWPERDGAPHEHQHEQSTSIRSKHDGIYP